MHGCLITAQIEKISKFGVFFALILVDKEEVWRLRANKPIFVKKDLLSNKNNLRQLRCKQTNFVFVAN